MMKIVSHRDVPILKHAFAPPHVIVLALALVAISCTRREPDNRVEWNEKVSEAVHAKVGNANRVTIDFDALMPFEWERVFVFPPYTRHEDIFDALGFRWRGTSGGAATMPAPS